MTDDALTQAIARIDAQFGERSVIRLGSAEVAEIEVIPSGSLRLDAALGIGGFPRGRVVEIFGPESSGKTTLVYHAIAQAQALGLASCFIDTEHAIDPNYAGDVGVDTDALYLSQPTYGEEALEIIDRLIQTNEVGLIVVDSVAALVPRAELEGEIGEQTVGLQARLMSQAMRKLSGHAHKANATIIFTNQLRANINTMGFGPTETTTGGRALRFYASQRIDLRRIETLGKATGMASGIKCRAKIVKNKLAPPLRIAEFEIDYGKGISREAELLDIGLECGIVKRKGAWYSLGEVSLGQGRDTAKSILLANGELRGELKERIHEETASN